MDAVFGDTTAHEEKARLYAIATSLGLQEAQAAAHDIKSEKALHAETSEL
jgi:2-hydroxychromene-2-carboxylate isomerase